MDENNEKSPAPPDDEPIKILESPRPLAFTVDFNDGKAIDTQRHKNLVEKLQKKHRRGQSLSKIEQSSSNTPLKKPLTGNLPRKSSFHSSEGYFSSDEKSDRMKNVSVSAKRSELSLPLRNVTTEKMMTQSYPNASTIFNVNTPDLELKDVSSPELVLPSPFSPRPQEAEEVRPQILRQYSSPECATQPDEINFVDASEFDFDKSDTVSDAGTYTLDADNYSEEQKARMSIDAEFKIEQISVLKKTEEYIKSLSNFKQTNETEITQFVHDLNLNTESHSAAKITPHASNVSYKCYAQKAAKMLSPILSPTQNLSITQNDEVLEADKHMNNGSNDLTNKTFTKIMFPSQKSRNSNGLDQFVDQGSVISVTSSGAFRAKSEKEKPNVRKLSLTKSEIQVEAYVDDRLETKTSIVKSSNTRKLTTNIINVQSISIENDSSDKILTGNLVLGKVSNLPPAVGGFSGKMSPSKIPSPIHTISRPRSRNSISSATVDLSDSSLETESYLKPTQNCINSLQQRLSLDSDQDSDYDNKYGLQLNNTPHNLLKQRATHIRHNSLDDKAMKISNKLEHFQSKNLQGIDQTFMFNQYNQTKIHNSPNNSPIRRSSSFSTKNQINVATKNTNLVQQEVNLVRNSPNLARSSAIQRSASTASIRPNYINVRRSSISSDHQRIDRNQFGDTESSSEDDFEKNLAKKKDLSNLTNTRYNRAFSLRRARLDDPKSVPPKCPNTPEMRRKFQPEHMRTERAISVDRKPIKTNDVQSRYLQNLTKKPMPVVNKIEPVKTPVPKAGNAMSKSVPAKPQVFSRTDSGRFSMRAAKPATPGNQKSAKKDGSGKKASGRSNSSLSSREKEFQNWKRRKSYDPMKAAAEGKRKELAKRQNIMTQSFTEANHHLQDCDSSPSHSSSVHRSQSFHGTAALEQLISSEEEEDLTLSADEGFSPPTPSPCELSPARASLRNAWKDHVLH